MTDVLNEVRGYARRQRVNTSAGISELPVPDGSIIHPNGGGRTRNLVRRTIVQLQRSSPQPAVTCDRLDPSFLGISQTPLSTARGGRISRYTETKKSETKPNFSPAGTPPTPLAARNPAKGGAPPHSSNRGHMARFGAKVGTVAPPAWAVPTVVTVAARRQHSDQVGPVPGHPSGSVLRCLNARPASQLVGSLVVRRLTSLRLVTCSHSGRSVKPSGRRGAVPAERGRAIVDDEL